jgi:hypothetical protein
MSEQEYVTKAGLKGKRGWTDGLIRDFLGEPDQTKKNPHYSRGAPMCLYALSRVEAVEATEEFIQRMAKIKSRRRTAKRAARQAVVTKWFKTLEIIEDVPPLPQMDRDELIECACDHYNFLWATRSEYKHATPSDDSIFLERICVNYLRHCMTNYDERLGLMHGRVGGQDAYSSIRQASLRAIADAYPHLEAACHRQGLRKATTPTNHET